MSHDNDTRVECSDCHTQLSIDHNGPCPSCGKTGTKFVHKRFSVQVKGKVSMTLLKDKRFTQIIWWRLPIAILATLGSSLVGYFFNGIKGLIIGLVLNLLSIYLWYIALIKAWHREHWHYE